MRLGTLVFTPTQNPGPPGTGPGGFDDERGAPGTALSASQTHSWVYLSLRAGLAAGEASTGAPGRVRPSMLPELLLCTQTEAPSRRSSTLKRFCRCTNVPITQSGAKGSSGAASALPEPSPAGQPPGPDGNPCSSLSRIYTPL